MLNIAICDDEVHLASEIEKMILKYARNTNENINVDVFSRGEDLIKSIKKGDIFDMIFLDIELGTTTGIELGNKIRKEFCDHTCKIVFISSKIGYEMKLFDIQPLNFLTKPINKEDLYNCIKLTISILEKENTIFEYKSNYHVIRCKIKDILYFESQFKKMKIVTINKVDFFYDNFENIKKRLPISFFKPHRSYLVNYNHVSKITTEEIFLFGLDITIPLTKASLKELSLLQLKLEKDI